MNPVSVRLTQLRGCARGPLAAGLICALLGSLGAAATARATTSHATEFNDPTGTITCGVTEVPTSSKTRRLICSESAGFWVLGTSGAASEITWNEPFSPLGGELPVTLVAGTHWSWESVTCTIALTSVTCANGQGHGFTDSFTTPPLLGAGKSPRVGFGKEKPTEVFFGGDPTGMFTKLSWSRWGTATATAKGEGFYDPPNQPTSASVRVPVILTASKLGFCGAHYAYRHLAVTFVYKGHDEPGTAPAICPAR